MGESIRVQTEAGAWEVLGVDRYEAVYPEDVVPTFNANGPEGLTFTIKRDANVEHLDLAAFTPVDYLRGGDNVKWSGYVLEAPSSGDQITVTCRGWQFYTDDDLVSALYVHSLLTEWVDSRSIPGVNLGTYRTSAAVEVGDGQIVLRYPPGATVAAGQFVGVTLDLGPARTARSVAVDVTTINTVTGLGLSLYARGHDAPDGATSGVSSDFIAAAALSNGATANYVGDVAAGRRYVSLLAFNPGAAQTLTATQEVAITLTGVRVFGLPAHRSGTASVVKASTVAADLPARFPLLSADLTQISATTLNLLHLIADDETGRALLDRVNSYHAWRWKVDEQRRLSFRAQAAVPLLVTDLAELGAEWTDASAASGQDLYNQVVVTGTSGSGQRLRVVRTKTNALTRRGRTRTYKLEVGVPTDAATMTALGDAFLSQHGTSTLKGTLTITGDNAVRLIGSDSPVGTGDLGAYTTEVITLANLIDPDTGALGRNGVVVAVSLSANVATLTIDNERGNFAALLARMGGT
jgi:hypothetical protein